MESLKADKWTSIATNMTLTFNAQEAFPFLETVWCFNMSTLAMEIQERNEWMDGRTYKRSHQQKEKFSSVFFIQHLYGIIFMNVAVQHNDLQKLYAADYAKYQWFGCHGEVWRVHLCRKTSQNGWTTKALFTLFWYYIIHNQCLKNQQFHLILNDHWKSIPMTVPSNFLPIICVSPEEMRTPLGNK